MGDILFDSRCNICCNYSLICPNKLHYFDGWDKITIRYHPFSLVLANGHDEQNVTPSASAR